MTPTLAAFLSGALFAVGLGVSGMTRPGKVLAFLDLGGAWDPSLEILARRAPLLVPQFSLPTRRDVDRRLVGGAALFGVGWGLAGFCPGPAVTSLVGGRVEPVIFVAAMLTGMALHRLMPDATARQPRDASASAAQPAAGAAVRTTAPAGEP